MCSHSEAKTKKRKISRHHTKGYQKALIKNPLRLNETIKDRIEETQCTNYPSRQIDERLRDVGEHIYV